MDPHRGVREFRHGCDLPVPEPPANRFARAYPPKGMPSLAHRLAIPALPAIRKELHASPNAVSWVLTAFLISASVATPLLGRLGDMFGKERVLALAFFPALAIPRRRRALAPGVIRAG
jgi:MFS family permease